MSMDNKKFTFLALAYNHEEYIIEHLESIKYLIETHGEKIHCELIINDDFSKDKTVYLIENWLDINEFVFDRVVKLFNNKNIGTCASVSNMLNNLQTDNVKLTACDDVYSFENIFKYSLLKDSISIRSGVPLSLVDGRLFEDRIDTANVVASDIIYKKLPLITRFKLLSGNNAPNIIYNKKHLLNENVVNFLNCYDVVDDWPIQVAIAENFPETHFDLVKKVLVYYRRTSGSAYIVAKGRFFDDKVRLYKYLINKETNVFYKGLLANRLFLFKLGSKVANKILNLSFFLFVLSALLNSIKIVSTYRKIDFNMDLHKKHYELIKSNAANISERIARDKA